MVETRYDLPRVAGQPGDLGDAHAFLVDHRSDDAYPVGMQRLVDLGQRGAHLAPRGDARASRDDLRNRSGLLSHRAESRDGGPQVFDLGAKMEARMIQLFEAADVRIDPRHHLR